jgi:hypothetical protein
MIHLQAMTTARHMTAARATVAVVHADATNENEISKSKRLPV